jgi:hypothetical protein
VHPGKPLRDAANLERERGAVGRRCLLTHHRMGWDGFAPWLQPLSRRSIRNRRSSLSTREPVGTRV